MFLARSTRLAAWVKLTAATRPPAPASPDRHAPVVQHSTHARAAARATWLLCVGREPSGPGSLLSACPGLTFRVQGAVAPSIPAFLKPPAPKRAKLLSQLSARPASHTLRDCGGSQTGGMRHVPQHSCGPLPLRCPPHAPACRDLSASPRLRRAGLQAPCHHSSLRGREQGAHGVARTGCGPGRTRRAPGHIACHRNATPVNQPCCRLHTS